MTSTSAPAAGTVLFLDFDGVLHPRPNIAPSSKPDLFTSLSLLEDVLRQVPEVEVVISSRWREHLSLDEMTAVFSEDIRLRTVGVNPLPPLEGVPEHLSDYTRHAECLVWLAQHRPPGTRWVALDDDPEDFAPRCPNLLLTDGSRGLTAASARQLLQRLRS